MNIRINYDKGDIPFTKKGCRKINRQPFFYLVLKKDLSLSKFPFFLYQNNRNGSQQ